QGAKPYAEIVADYGRFLRTEDTDFYSVGGGLKNLPAAGDRKWFNQEFRVMYHKRVGPWEDQIRVRTANLDLGLDEDFLVSENRT
ncbi:hypothetical protein ACI3QN_13145, partial [Propionibacterium freudenreichii]|uniref:hypothetical protein n=1 Tax=Propionibacterium freudenreichii TaxID=1744 RepID=UPI0038527DCC